MNLQGLAQIRPAKTWDDVEAAIRLAVEFGILIDKRGDMPRGRDAQGKLIEWKRTRATPADVLGHCAHQNGSQNFTKPISTGRYHTSKKQHITPGRPLASTCYPIMIPDVDGPAWLTADLDWITYAQGDNDAGDENRHLIAVLVMGGFEDSGFKRSWTKPAPSDDQMAKLSAVVAWLQRVFDYGAEGYFGHFDFGKASCPGRAVRQWTEAARDSRADLVTDLDWQRALLRWDPHALPTFGADDDWGRESRYAVVLFQRAHGISQTAQQDPFTELILLQRYPAPAEVLDTTDMQPPVIVKHTAPRLAPKACGKGRKDCPVIGEHGHCGDCDGAVTGDNIDGEAWNSEFGCLCRACYDARKTEEAELDDPEDPPKFDTSEPTIDITPPAVEQIDDPEDPPDWPDGDPSDH